MVHRHSDVIYLLVKSINNQLYFKWVHQKITDIYCTYDGSKIDEVSSKPCKLCGYVYCKDHLSPTRHQCSMLQNVEYVKTDSFSNITASFSSNDLKETSSIEAANPKTTSGVEKVDVVMTPNVDGTSYWLSDCLEDAKNMIVECYDEKPDDKIFADCAKFFASKIFDVKLQNNGNASGDINLIRNLSSQPSYKICVHDMFKENTRDNRRMVTVILIHQLLHALHPSRMHDFTNGQKGINKIEHELANRASYHDAVLNLESLHQSGKISLCNV
jgi:hypothetical protein